MKKKYIAIAVSSVLLCAGVLTLFLGCGIVLLMVMPRDVHADNITFGDQKQLQEYCLKEFQTPRYVRLGHSHGGNGTIYICVDEKFRDSEKLDFKNIEFISKTYEGKDYEGKNELSLYFKINGYCVVEQQEKTFYSYVTLTNPKRVLGKLVWDEIDIAAIVKFDGVSYMYSFGDEP